MTKPMLTRPQPRKAALLGAAALGLTAGAALAETVTLSVWSDQPRLPSFERFDALDNGVDLDILIVDPGDLVSRLQLGMQAGSELPDVIFMSDIGFTAQLSTRGSNFLLELNDLVPQSLVDEFYENSNSPCVIGDRLLCLRNDMAHMILWYNQPQMEELGLEVPTTWEEFEALGEVVGPMGMALGTGVEPFPLLSYLVSGGCDVAMPVEGEVDTLRIDLSTPECIRAAEMVDNMLANGSLTRTGPFDPAFVTMASEGLIPLMLGPTWFGEYVIRPVYEWEPGVLAAALPPHWEWQDAPLTWSWGGGTFGGWKDTAHPEAVAGLIMWAAADVENQTNAVTLPAHEPSALAWGAGISTDPFYATGDVFDIQVEAAPFSHPGYVSLRFSVTDAVAGTLSAAASTGGSVVEALPALETELRNIAQLNRYTVQ
ncbi:MAG: extracellular solute-binding protein [Rubellimicrobium sp.]|nr:extracellular solute-binding protein [Rubellimicrobium sp.]